MIEHGKSLISPKREVGRQREESRVAGTRISVIGCGHVGLVTAAGFAQLGHAVVGLDIDAALVEAISGGRAPFLEPGLDDLLSEGLRNGRLRFTTDYGDALRDPEYVFLTVDTPSTPAGAANLSRIRAAARSIKAVVGARRPIIVNKSTSPIGTGETIESILTEGLGDGGDPPRIVSNPEFLREGHAVHDFLNPNRIVVGAKDRLDADAVASLFEGLGAPVIRTDLRTAEMIKYVANSYLATRISFVNEIARLCEALGTDVDRVVEGVGLDPRIGLDYFSPGLGFGGSCLPKDIAALRFTGESLGVATPILNAVDSINRSRPGELIRRVRSEIGGLEGCRVGIWGVTFKGGSEDTRDSPALAVIDILLNEGADISVFDPASPIHVPPAVMNAMVSSAIDAAKGADALLVLTDWAQFSDVPMPEVAAALRGHLVLDGRNVLDPDAVTGAGLTYMGVGRPTRVPSRVTVS
jgi:UDPglucose 6-dehydrogenase